MRLEELSKHAKKLNMDSRSPDRDLKPGPSEYEAGALLLDQDVKYLFIKHPKFIFLARLCTVTEYTYEIKKFHKNFAEYISNMRMSIICFHRYLLQKYCFCFPWNYW
jgi:hypothetical protein